MGIVGIDRRQFLATAGGSLGLGVLSACGSSSSPTAAPATSKRPPISAEPGTLSILEWAGYEAHGTKAQTYGLLAGSDYTKKYGASGITYTYIVNDDQALAKATSGGPFDIMHPCHENIPDYVNRGLVQPWDTSLLPSFKQLNPSCCAATQINGKQYHDPVGLGLRRASCTAPTRSTRRTPPAGSSPGTRSTRARSRCGTAPRPISRSPR